MHERIGQLLDSGLADAAGMSGAELRAAVTALPEDPDGIIAAHPRLISASALAALVRHRGKAGFVVCDLIDLESFAPIPEVTIPDAPLYLIHDVDRGDDLRNWTAKEALPTLLKRGRTPLTVHEGLSWLLQEPHRLERNYCFMTIASRKRTERGLDARTPAVWISSGTGRDGVQRRGAPKVGWCWAGNRHTWLGMASAARRSGRP